MNELNTLPWNFVKEKLETEKNPLEDIKEELSPQNLETLQDFTEDGIFTIIKDLHSTHMMNYAPIEDWKEFLNSYRTMVLECFFSSQNESIHARINFYQMVNDFEKKLSKDFCLEHSFKPIEMIFQNKTKTTFEKSRLIQKLIDGYSTKTKMLSHFTYEHWNYFFQNMDFFIEKRFEWDKIYKFVTAKIPILLSIEVQKVNIQIYQIFLQNNLHFCDTSLDSFFLNFLFDPQTNVQDGTIWIRNEKPYTVRLNGEPFTESNLEDLRGTTMTVSILEKIPFSFVPLHHRNYLKNLCHNATSGILPFETWNFFDTKRNHITLETILKECFHIIGRISFRYKLRSYHKSLFEKFNKKLLVWKKLHSSPNPILFPEYSFQTKEWKKSWNEQWNGLYQFFLMDVFTCMSGNLCTKEYFIKDYNIHQWKTKLSSFQKEYEDTVEQQKKSNIPFLYEPQQKILQSRIYQMTEKIQKYETISMDLLPMSPIECQENIGDFIGTEHILDVLNKKKTYSQYFNKDSFLPVHTPAPYNQSDHQDDFLQWYDMQSFSKKTYSNPKKSYAMFLDFVQSQMNHEKKIFNYN